MKVIFASSNKSKFTEVKSILALRGIEVEMADIKIGEIQSDELQEVAANKAEKAHAVTKRPVLVEDDGLFIEVLDGFPGAYSSYVFKTIGNAGILKLLQGSQNRNAHFVAFMGYHDGDSVRLFCGTTRGTISLETKGEGWGFDPIFIPEGGGGLTYAQLEKRKGEFSHRRKALDAFASSMAER